MIKIPITLNENEIFQLKYTNVVSKTRTIILLTHFVLENCILPLENKIKSSPMMYDNTITIVTFAIDRLLLSSYSHNYTYNRFLLLLSGHGFKFKNIIL